MRYELTLTHAQNILTDEVSTWHGVMAEEEKCLQCRTSTDTVCNTLKTHTKYAHSVRGRPTLKDFMNFMRDLFISEHL